MGTEKGPWGKSPPLVSPRPGSAVPPPVLCSQVTRGLATLVTWEQSHTASGPTASLQDGLPAQYKKRAAPFLACLVDGKTPLTSRNKVKNKITLKSSRLDKDMTVILSLTFPPFFYFGSLLLQKATKGLNTLPGGGINFSSLWWPDCPQACTV